MGLSQRLVYARPTFLVIIIIQPLKDVRCSSTVGVEETITDFQQWSNAIQHVVSEMAVVNL